MRQIFNCIKLESVFFYEYGAKWVINVTFKIWFMLIRPVCEVRVYPYMWQHRRRGDLTRH